MQEKCLDEIISFTLGKNGTRLKASEGELYTQDDFDSDLYSKNETIDRCIISMIRSKAAPLSMKTVDKCVNSNFLICSFDANVLDPWYFCYQFNEGKSIEQQIAMYHQGNTLCVKKLNIKSIGTLKISMPDINKQRLIGQMYKQSIVQQDLMLQQAENYRNLMINTIRKIEED